MYQMNRIVFSLSLEDNVRIDVSVRTRPWGSGVYAVTRRRVISKTFCNRGWRKCKTCEKTAKKSEMIVSKGMCFCSIACRQDYWNDWWDTYNEASKGIQLCNIIQTHDALLADDPERIDIRNFLHKHIECA